MKYTIKDNNNNLICSVESDPVKSTERNEGKLIAGASLLLGGIFLINLFKKKKNKAEFKKISDKYGKDSLSRLGDYIYNTSKGAQKIIFNKINDAVLKKYPNTKIDDDYNDDAYATTDENDLAKLILKNELKGLCYGSYAQPILKIPNLKLDLNNESECNRISNELENICIKSLSEELIIPKFEAKIIKPNLEIEEDQYIEESNTYIVKLNISFIIQFNDDILESILSKND